MLGYSSKFVVLFYNLNHDRNPQLFRFKGKTLDIYCTFVPQMIFLQSLIGYLCFMIFFKWFACGPRTTQPSLLICLINMFLQFGSPIEEEMTLYGNQVICLMWDNLPWIISSYLL